MKKTILILVAVIGFGVCIMSCKKENDPKGTIDLTLGNYPKPFITKGLVAIDQHGNERVYDLHSTYDLCWISPNQFKTTLKNVGNFELSGSDSYYQGLGFGTYNIDGICSVENVKGLGDITDIPVSGFENTVDCKKGCGYIVRYVEKGDDTYSFIKYTSHVTYARMYVVSISGGGAKVKYQYPFQPKGVAQ